MKTITILNGMSSCFSVPNIFSLETTFSSLLKYPKAPVSVVCSVNLLLFFIYYFLLLFRTPSDCMALEQTDVCFYLNKSSLLQNAKKMATLARLHWWWVSPTYIYYHLGAADNWCVFCQTESVVMIWIPNQTNTCGFTMWISKSGDTVISPFL